MARARWGSASQAVATTTTPVEEWVVGPGQRPPARHGTAQLADGCWRRAHTVWARGAGLRRLRNLH